MPDRAVLLVEPESSGVELVPAARRLGFAVHVADRRAPADLPAPVRAAVSSGVVTHHLADTRSVTAVRSVADRLARSTDLAAVLPGFEYAVPVVAAVAARLGLPGLPPATAGALRDKRRMKGALRSAGVPVAAGVELDPGHAGDPALGRAVAAVGFPAVVKPVDGSGSLQVRRVDDLAELRAHLAEVAAAPLDDLGLLLGRRVLVESYVDGPEFSVEGWADRTGRHVLAVTAKQLGPEPHFVEVGHVVDAPVSAADRAALAATAGHAVAALGLTAGVFHVELRLTARGPVVLEAAARLAGDRIPRLVAHTHRVDLADVLVRVLAGLPVPTPPPGPTGVAAVRYLTVPAPTRLPDPNRLAVALAAVPHCVEVAVDVPEGAWLRPATDFRQRFGHAVFAASDRDRLDIAVTRADRLVAEYLDEVVRCAS